MSGILATSARLQGDGRPGTFLHRRRARRPGGRPPPCFGLDRGGGDDRRLGNRRSARGRRGCPGNAIFRVGDEHQGGAALYARRSAPVRFLLGDKKTATNVLPGPTQTAGQVLRSFREQTWEQCVIWSSSARRWRRASTFFAVISTAGSGVAAATAALGSGTGTDQTVVVVLAFLGSLLTGVAAAVGAPNQAKDATLRADSLASWTHRADLALVGIDDLPLAEARATVRDLLDWRDQIYGVTVPAPLPLLPKIGPPLPDNPAE